MLAVGILGSSGPAKSKNTSFLCTCGLVGRRHKEGKKGINEPEFVMRIRKLFVFKDAVKCLDEHTFEHFKK